MVRLGKMRKKSEIRKGVNGSCVHVYTSRLIQCWCWCHCFLSCLWDAGDASSAPHPSQNYLPRGRGSSCSWGARAPTCPQPAAPPPVISTTDQELTHSVLRNPPCDCLFGSFIKVKVCPVVKHKVHISSLLLLGPSSLLLFGAFLKFSKNVQCSPCFLVRLTFKTEMGTWKFRMSIAAVCGKNGNAVSEVIPVFYWDWEHLSITGVFFEHVLSCERWAWNLLHTSNYQSPNSQYSTRSPLTRLTYKRMDVPHVCSCWGLGGEVGIVWIQVLVECLWAPEAPVNLDVWSSTMSFKDWLGQMLGSARTTSNCHLNRAGFFKNGAMQTQM